MDETYSTYVDDECFDIHDYDDDTDHDTVDDTDDDISDKYGRGGMRCKHLFCDRILKFHNFGSDILFLIREFIESKSKNRTFRIVGSEG